MKLILTAGVSALLVGSACVVMSSMNHEDQCARFTAQQISKNQSHSDWDKLLGDAGYKPVVRREPLVSPTQEIIDQFPGADPCRGTNGMELLNAILAGILTFAAIVIPPMVLRGLFPNRGTHR